MKQVTQEEIREQYGKCDYCEKEEILYFCLECKFGVCDKCSRDNDQVIEMGKCPSDCFMKLPDLVDIEALPKQ